MKFDQFAYANFGWPQRVFASEVGFLASWWVGMLAGWFLARLGLVDLPDSIRRKQIALSFAIVFVTAIVAGIIGITLGEVVAHHSDLKGWSKWKQVLELDDLQSFVVVAYLHAASYLGALVGFVIAAVLVRRRLRTESKRGLG